MPDGIGRMPFPPKMDSFQAEVRCHQRLMTCWNAEDGAIVAEADYKFSSSTSAATKPRNQRFFGEGHSDSLYKSGRLSPRIGMPRWEIRSR